MGVAWGRGYIYTTYTMIIITCIYKKKTYTKPQEPEVVTDYWEYLHCCCQDDSVNGIPVWKYRIKIQTNIQNQGYEHHIITPLDMRHVKEDTEKALAKLHCTS